MASMASMFRGYGRPWARTLVSSATTARPSWSASLTGSASTNDPFMVGARTHQARCPRSWPPLAPLRTPGEELPRASNLGPGRPERPRRTHLQLRSGPPADRGVFPAGHRFSRTRRARLPGSRACDRCAESAPAGPLDRRLQGPPPLARWRAGRSPSFRTISMAPVLASVSTVSRASTPREASSSASSLPGRSSPTRPYRRTSTPSRAAHTAAFAPAPPGRRRTSPWTSPPVASAPASTLTSTITSPTTIRSGRSLTRLY